MLRVSFLIWLLVTSSYLASGQEKTWSLQDCIAVAMQNSLEVKASQLAVERAQKTHTNLLLDLFPSISLSANHSYNFGSTIDPATNNRVSSDIQWDNFYLNASTNLLDFQNIALQKRNKIAIDLANADKAVVEYEYKLQILEKYFDALFSQELVKIQKEQLQNSTFNLDRIVKEVEIGSKAQSDLYDIKFSFSQDQKRLLEAEQLFEMQKKQLFQLMNRNDEVANVTLQMQMAPVETPLEIINPKIESAQLSYEISKKELAIERAINLPVLRAFYSWSSFYSAPLNIPNANIIAFHQQFNDNKNQQVGLQLDVPVFNGFRRNRQIGAAKIEAERVRVISENEKIKVQRELEIENLKKDQFQKLVPSIENTLLYAKESFRTSQSKFTSGIIEAVVFIAVKNQLLTSQYDALKNSLQVQLTSYRINLISSNQL